MATPDKFLLRAGIHGRQSRHVPPDVFQAFGDKAALLLDSAGTIRSATESAARMLHRPAVELTGLSFGIVPMHPAKVQLDVNGARGERMAIAASALPSGLGRNWNLVLLDDCSRSVPLAVAGRQGIRDAAHVLAVHRLELRIAEWPQVMVLESLRPMLADTIACLAALWEPCECVLHIGSSIAADYAVISLHLTGGQTGAGTCFARRFEESLRRVKGADGYLSVEAGGPGVGLELALPLA